MKTKYAGYCAISLLLILSLSCKSDETKMIAENDVLRVGMVIKIKPEYIDEYRTLHSETNRKIVVY